MTTLRMVPIAGALFGAAIGIAAAQDRAPAQGERDGKAVFLEFKCNTCHTLDSAGIAKRKASASEDAEEKTDKEAPDLSSVGLERTTDWIAKYVTKKETIKGERHVKRFKGKDSDLRLVAEWLAGRKAKPKTTGKKAAETK